MTVVLLSLAELNIKQFINNLIHIVKYVNTEQQNKLQKIISYIYFRS